MAGQAGQPSPKPQSLPDPFETADTGVDPFESADTGVATEPQAQGYRGFGSGALQTVADWAPTAGGVAGAIAGAPALGLTGGASSIAGAGLGGMAGNSVRRLIEVDILGKNPETMDQELYKGAFEGAKEAIGQMTGLALTKGASALAKTKAGAAVVDTLADYAAKPITYVRSGMKEAYDKVAGPFLDLVAEKRSPLNIEQAGDAVKQIFKKDVTARFGKYAQASDQLNQVAKTLPLGDKARLDFYDKAYGWAQNELSLDNQKLAGKWLNKLIEPGNMAGFDSVRREMGRAIKEAAETYGEKSTQAKALGEIRDRADDFIEARVVELANKIKNGKANPAEMGGFQQMMAMQKNPTVPLDPKNLNKYVQSVAKDFLDERKNVKRFYSQYRNLVEDVGTQTRINPSGLGAERFLEKMDSVPSEKLVNRMFDPMNARELRELQKKMPEAFEHVTKTKMSELVRQASPTGDLDLRLLQRSLNKLPEPTRNILLGEGKMEMINKTMGSLKLKAIEGVQGKTENAILRGVVEAATLAGIIGKKVAKDIPDSATARQMIGKPIASPLVNAFIPDQIPESLRAPQE